MKYVIIGWDNGCVQNCTFIHQWWFSPNSNQDSHVISSNRSSPTPRLLLGCYEGSLVFFGTGALPIQKSLRIISSVIRYPHRRAVTQYCIYFELVSVLGIISYNTISNGEGWGLIIILKFIIELYNHMISIYCRSYPKYRTRGTVCFDILCYSSDTFKLTKLSLVQLQFM